MRKIALLLGILFLLQSCVSYKQVDINPKTMALGQDYKIDRVNHKMIKGNYTQNADSAIVVYRNGAEEKILVKDITRVRAKKFSLVKTIALYPIVVLGLAGIFVYGMSN